MNCYLNDERLAAYALHTFHSKDIVPDEVYRDLLSIRWSKWIDKLEEVAENILWTDLKEWCLNKQAELDMFGDKLWGVGDIALIEKAGWKLVQSNQGDED